MEPPRKPSFNLGYTPIYGPKNLRPKEFSVKIIFVKKNIRPNNFRSDKFLTQAFLAQNSFARTFLAGSNYSSSIVKLLTKFFEVKNRHLGLPHPVTCFQLFLYIRARNFSIIHGLFPVFTKQMVEPVISQPVLVN